MIAKHWLKFPRSKSSFRHSAASYRPGLRLEALEDRCLLSAGFTEFSVPTASGEPVGITPGADGNLWFTEINKNKIGRIAPAGTVTEFTVPTAGSGPFAITAGPDGNFWFTESSTNNIGRITPAGTITEFTVPTVGSGPKSITGRTSDGATPGSPSNLATRSAGSRPLERSPSSPCPRPTAIPLASRRDRTAISGSPRVPPASSAVSPLPEPLPSSPWPRPKAIFGEITPAGPDAKLWFTVGNDNKIGCLTLTWDHHRVPRAHGQ